MNKILRGLLLCSAFVQFLFLRKPIPTTLALFGISSVFIVFLLFLIGKKENTKIAFPYIWLWAFLQMLWYNLKGTSENMDVSVLYLVHISIFFMLFYSVAQSKIDYKYILRPLMYVCIITSVYSILQRFGIDQFKFDLFGEPGTLGNPTNTAMYIAVTSPFLLFHKRGWFYMVIPLAAIVMLGSASAFLGFYFMILTVLFLRKRYAGIISMLTISGIGIYFKYDFFIQFFTANKKLIVWNMAIGDWMKRAWFGYGLGHFAGRYTTHNGTVHWGFMQNHYLYILFTLGIVGLFFLTVFLMPILKNRREVLPFASVIAVLIMSVCSVPMRIYPIVLLTSFNLGVLTKGEVNEETISCFDNPYDCPTG